MGTECNMEEQNQVSVYIYDLSAGFASALSQPIIGKKLEGIWHTGVVAYGREYFFGSSGIQSCTPGGTILGEPVRVEQLGVTEVPYKLFLEYIFGLGESTFAPGSYDLLTHNCNNFADEVSVFLCGRGLPVYILNLPDEVINTPLGRTLAPLLSALSLKSPNIPNSTAVTRADSPELQELAQTAQNIRQEEVGGEQSHETSNGVDSDKSSSTTPTNMPDEASVSLQNTAATSTNLDPDESVTRVAPIVFKDAVQDVKGELDSLSQCVECVSLTDQYRHNLSELRQYLLDGEGAWALGENFISFIGAILHGDTVSTTCRVHLLRLISTACLRDDFILILHQDRKDHVLMNYADKIDRLSEEEQMALTLAFANMFEQNNCSEWLLYISEWQNNTAPGSNNTTTSTVSNIRVTTKVAVNALLAEHNSFLQETGTAIMYNLAVKEKLTTNHIMRQSMPAGSLNRVFDDVATELAMAVLQYFQSSPPEELVFRCLTALSRFSQVSYNDVPQLIKMIGPTPDKFCGMSDRCDKLVHQLESQLSRVQI